MVFHPSDRYIFATLNAEGRVAKLDLKTGAVRAKVATGSAPRSMDISADGRSLYVVNYESGTVTKLRASDMSHCRRSTVLSPDRDHLRQGDQARLGGLLHRLDPRLQRLVAPRRPFTLFGCCKGGRSSSAGLAQS